MKIHTLIKVALKIKEEDLPEETTTEKLLKNTLLDRIKNKKGTLTSSERLLRDNLVLNDKKQNSSLLKRFITSRLGAGSIGFGLGIPTVFAAPLTGVIAGEAAQYGRQDYANKALLKNRLQ